MKPETVFRQRVMKDLKELDNTMVFSIQQKAIVGDPDMILCINGQFVALELKTETGRLSEMQKYKLARVRKCLGIDIVSRPSTWKDDLAFLTKLSNSGRMM